MAIAVSHAAYGALFDLFPGQVQLFDALMDSLGLAPPKGEHDLDQPINTPAEIRDPNRWQPVRLPDGHGGFIVQTFLGAQWGVVQPFAVAPASERRPSGPRRLPVDRYEYVRQSGEILDLSADLDDERKVIAEYWAPNLGTEAPPGRWSEFAGFVSRRDRHTLTQDVVMFFALSGALLDASILAWDAKRAFDSVRPITAIHFILRGQKVRA